MKIILDSGIIASMRAMATQHFNAAEEALATARLVKQWADDLKTGDSIESAELNDPKVIARISSRSGGPDHILTRMDDVVRCTCKSGQTRGRCWATDAYADGYGVATDRNGDKYILDERFEKHYVRT